MNIHTRAVHAGDRKQAGTHIPVTTPIHAASSYFYRDIEELDRVFGGEQRGFSYGRYGNPSNAALEELTSALEGGHGSLACSSGMAALQIAILAALTDRRKSILAADALFGATFNLLMTVFEPLGVEVGFVNMCDLGAVERAIGERKPGCLVMEAISNPILRVAELDRIAELARASGAALVVDNTFATPLVLKPLELGAHLVVHSLTKYLAGHGDMMGGVVISTAQDFAALTALARVTGPALGPFDCFLAMRGIKTFPLRMERQCENAAQVAAALARNPNVARVYYPGDPLHPDAAAIRRLFPAGLYGAIISLELRDAGREDVFRFMNALKMVVPATSLGDVHTMTLYPAMSSHRELSPKQRARMNIGENLVRISVGIEAVEDILADLEQALAAR
jgi:cystathionine gamma-synthase/methionine-gamma-lyase